MRFGLSLFLCCAAPCLQAAAPTASTFAKLPLAFERQGTALQERYVARGNGYQIALQGGSAAIGLQPQSGPGGSIVMDFAGSRKVAGTAGPELPGKVNYLRGNDPKQWRLGLPTYGSVTFREIYPAIDVLYRGNQRQMEFDLVLGPGANPGQIRLKFAGARELTLDTDGALAIHSAAGDLRIPLPAIYQDIAGARQTVRGRYHLLPNQEVGFRLEEYDRARPLVIDPTIVYAGLIGGGTNTSISYSIAVDSSSNSYIAGYTYASDFPTANAVFSQMHATPDGFVSKIDPTGTTLLYSTYIGGSGSDYFRSLAVDSTGAVWATGYTTSVDFPVLNAYQSTLNTTSGSTNAVVVKLSPSGSGVYSTFLGSNSQGYGIAVDPAGNAYAAGYVSGYFPTTAGVYLINSAGGYDGFVTKFNSSGGLVYSTFLGGNDSDYAYAIAADGSGNAYITGYSYSTTFPSAPAGGAQGTNAGSWDGFVAKLNPAGSALMYFTFLGGTGADQPWAIALDAGGNAYIGGYTSSSDLPVTAAAFQRVAGGASDGFVAKLNSAGTAFTYVTYLGGSRSESVQGLAVDGSGNAYATGYTNSAQFPTAAAIEGSLPGNSVSLFQTTNSGASWAPFDTNIPGAVNSISPDPGAAGVIVAATTGGIFKSANSGLSWPMVSSYSGTYLSRSPANSSTLYAIQCCTMVMRSIDGGSSWVLRGNPGTNENRIVADPTNANIAYAYYAQNSYPLQKTTDGGATWNPATNGLPSSSPNIYSMVAASDGSLYLEVGGWGVYKSTDQGASWVAVNSGLGSYTAALNGLAVSPSNPAVLYKSANSSVLYKSVNGGASWTSVYANVPLAFGALAVAASNPNLIYAASISVPLGSFVSADGGVTWNPLGIGLGISTAVIQIVTDPLNASAAYTVASVNQSAFVAKINPSGGGMIYSTYLGSSGTTYGYGIAANASGDAFVTGYSYGTFPVTPASFQGSPNSYEGFVVRISDATAGCSSLSITPATQTVYSGATAVIYSVLAPSGCAWTANSNQSWAAISTGASGSGSGLVSVAVSPNSTGAARTAGLTIGSHAASITQAPSSCSYTLGTPSVSLGANGGAVQTTILTGTGCPWTVVNNYPLVVSVTSASSGTGSGTVSLNVSPSASQTPRTLNIAIGSVTLSIAQAGYCSYVFTPASILLGGGGGSGSVAVATQNGCAWTASSNNTSWLTITSATSGIGSGTINYTASANSGTNRSASLNIAGSSVPVSETLGQAYAISTLAGGPVQPQTVTAATSVSTPTSSGVALDSSGKTYFSSAVLNTVFRADAGGLVTRIAGTGVGGYLGDGGGALNARLNTPQGLAVDPLGSVYIADAGNNRIRKVDTNGIITTVAGNGNCCYAGDGGAATNANLNSPQGVTLDSLGNLYIADYNNHRIRKVDTNGIISTVAGNGISGYSGDGGAATSAQLYYPQGMAVDASGNLYIADRNNRRVRKVDPNGIITTVAGNGNCCYSGDGDPAISAQLNNPNGVAVDPSGTLYIADGGSARIRRVAANGIITTVAGNGNAGFSGDGGSAASAQLNNPMGVALDSAGSLYIADVNNERIRKVAAGVITTLVGGSTGDGMPAVFGSLNGPRGVTRDSTGNILIADTLNHRIRKVATDGAISTLAGTGASGFSGDSGAAGSAMLNQPSGVALDSSGNLYVADAGNRRVRKIALDGTITTVAGNGTCCYSGDTGAATSANLNWPQGVALDSAGNLYIADANSHTIRKVALNGIITTIAGTGTFSGYSGDGSPATSALLNSPQGVALDAAGNVYIADSNNNRIRKVGTNGVITTVAGNGTCCYSGDSGPATSAQINYPAGVFVDGAGNLYIAENNGQRIRKVDAGGTITTIAGNGNYNYSGDGGPAISGTLRNPAGVFVDAAGNVYVAELSNNAIRLLTPASASPVLTIQSTHNGNFSQGQNGATYSLTISNAPGAGPTVGTVTVADATNGLMQVSMSGSGWLCPGSTCTRSDALSGGNAYPAITVTVNVPANAPTQVTTLPLMAGGGARLAGNTDFTIIAPSSAPPAPVLISPANGATGVSLTPTLTWNPSTGATSYDVYFGTAATPPFIANTTNTSYAPGLLNSSATYHWSVTAKNGVGGNSSGIWSFAENCVSALNPAAASFGSAATSGSVPVAAPGACAWNAASNAGWLNITGGSPGNGNGTVNYSVAANSGLVRVGTLTIGGQTFTVTQAASVFASQTYLVSTLAGGAMAPTQAAGASVALPNSYGIAVDANGNLYFPSPSLNAVFKANAGGVVTRIAGTGAGGYSGDGGAALGAMLNYPNSVAMDSLGNLYIADTNNNRIRKMAPNGVITTVAGNGSCCFAGDGGSALSAWLNNPFSVAVDAFGNVYIADSNNNRIRKVAANGIITTVAGNGSSGFSGDSGPAVSAQLSSPRGVATDALGSLYIADSNNHRIRKVALGGTITTVAGNGICCYSGDGGQATGAEINYPTGVTLDASGNLYFASTNSPAIRKVALTGIITTVAGNGSWGYSGDGGPAAGAQLNGPRGVAVDGSGNLYIADAGNQRIRKVSAAGVITTLVGGAIGDGGPAILANLNQPMGGVLDSAGNMYIADSNNNRIRKVAANGTITTVAGTGTSGFSGDGAAATGAMLNTPQGVALDASGNLYIADAFNWRVRKVSTNGTISTVAGTGNCCYPTGDGGLATSANVLPRALAVDSAGNLYIADTNNPTIRKVAPNGTITTIAGNGTWGYSGDGSAATSAQLANPQGVAVDALGNVYIADSGNLRIRKVATNGTITTVAGNGSCCYSGDGGPATGAQLNNPTGIALDAVGNMYISDPNSTRVRKVDLTGTITTIAGSGGYSYSGDGGPAGNATFRNPIGVFVDASGNVYLADQINNAIRMLTPTGTLPVLTIQSVHSGAFAQSQTGATYTVTVSNAIGAGPASGLVTVTETLPAGLTLVSMSGTGWTCPANYCTRNSTLAAGASYPAITVTVNVAGSAAVQVTNQTTVSGGGAPLAAATDLTLVGPAPLRFVSITPCRVVDTRSGIGSFGGPAISGGASRDFIIPNGACGVPTSAQAYSFNVTVVPPGALGYLTLWPAGQARPAVSTVNSDGRFKSNAAIVPAGTGGAVSVFASDATHVILDINGYFVSAADPTALAFYPITPCRIADTRTANGPLGGPSLGGGATRTFPILGTCNLPPTAQAYSLNFAAVPGGHSLGYVTAWPTGQVKPGVSSLSAPTGTVVANAAIVKAGTNGSIDIFASDATNFVIDVNGYFAPMGAGGLSLYGVAPCRVVDTRKPAGSLPISNQDVGVSASACGIPASAQAHVMAVTVVPPASMGYLTLWPQGQARPGVSTLNALDGAVTSNLAIVPTLNGWISAYASNATHLVLDISGYFGQ